MSNEEGEKWIVNLIRDSRMGVDAKIDLASVRSSLEPAIVKLIFRTCYTSQDHTQPQQLPSSRQREV
jgi:hypothetical protein